MGTFHYFYYYLGNYCIIIFVLYNMFIYIIKLGGV